MKNTEFKKLIEKYLSGRANKDEERILFQEYDFRQKVQFPWFSKLMGEKEEVSNKIHLRILKKIEHEENTKKKNQFYFKVAATLLLLLSTGLYFYLNQQSNSKQIANHSQENIQPGQDKAFLILDNGNKISLNNLKNGQIIEQKGAHLKKTSDGVVSYQPAFEPSNLYAQETFNTIQTPKGGQYVVLLSDGTKVWLNASSSLRYPAAFLSDKRIVVLSGEAYFEVAKSSIPFVVKADKQEIEVLGTHFNIQSYKDEYAKAVTLLEGSVRVTPTNITDSESSVLLPGQQAIITNKMTIREVDVNKAIAWKNGYFQFTEADLKTVMRQLARWYDVEIIYKSTSLPKKSFSGKINRKIDIEHVFDMLKYFEVDFQIQGRSIIIQ